MTQITLNQEKIITFCQENHIRKLALFGSVLREDFRFDSDVDVLVDFDSEYIPSLFQLVNIQTTLGNLLGREVDLGTFDSVLQDPNYIRRNAILNSAQVIYER